MAPTPPTPAPRDRLQAALAASVGRSCGPWRSGSSPRGRWHGRSGGEGIAHGTHLVLVDGQGRIRGYYDPDAPGAGERVVGDASLLVNRG